MTAENKIVVGSYNTEIPASVKVIGENSFRNNSSLMEIEIPEGVETIEPNAFSESIYLMRVTMPRSVTSIDDISFSGSGMGTPSRTVFMVWSDSYAKQRVEELNYPYILLDDLEEEPPLIANATFEVIPEGRQYNAFETVGPDNFIIKIFYYDEEEDKIYDEPEIITDYEVKYNDGSMDSLGGGYNTVTFIFDTEKGYKDVKIDLTLYANFLMPEYEIPTDISAYSGQSLGEIELPQGFIWRDESEFIDEAKTEYLADYMPEDSIHYMIVEKIAIPITIKTATTFSELFPDEALRLCIVNTINEQETAEYTEETIEVDKVLELTELDCAYTDGGEKITNTRGVEKLTNLKRLNLANNSIDKINLSKNVALETLDLRGNQISKLNIENNEKLDEFLIDESALEGGEVIVSTATYAEMEYEDEGVPHLKMDFSKLDFLKDKDFSLEAVMQDPDKQVTIEYDEDTGVVRIKESVPIDSVRVTVRLDNGDTISYIIDAKPRRFFFTTYFDGKLFEKEASFMYSYTGGIINIKELASEVAEFYGMSGYALEEYTIANDEEYIVGTSDVYLTFKYAKIAQGDDPDPGTDPGTNPDPGVDPGTGTDPDPGASTGDGDNADPVEDNITDNPQTIDSILPIMVAFVALALTFVFIVFGRKSARRRNS